ncbi:MAG TPA: hypothetical protein VKU94_07570 [Geobacterales bacterium]|nr:hypothetical protein [Geobacterales bacterium]
MRLLFIKKVSRKSVFMNILNLLQSPYYSGVILGISVMLKYGEFLSNFLSDCYRLNVKSVLDFPIISGFIEEELFTFISNLGFDALITLPDAEISKFIRKHGMGLICYGYVEGRASLNELISANLRNIDCDGIFTLNANKEMISLLKINFRKVTMNLGEVKGDIEIEIFRDLT